jgi:hypothetical protein
MAEMKAIRAPKDGTKHVKVLRKGVDVEEINS